MNELYRPNGDRVHCGDVLYIRVGGTWRWARFEMGSNGEGYMCDNEGWACRLNAIEAIDFTKR